MPPTLAAGLILSSMHFYTKGLDFNFSLPVNKEECSDGGRASSRYFIEQDQSKEGNDDCHCFSSLKSGNFYFLVLVLV